MEYSEANRNNHASKVQSCKQGQNNTSSIALRLRPPRAIAPTASSRDFSYTHIENTWPTFCPGRIRYQFISTIHQSSITIHHHLSSSIIIHHHPSPSIILYHNPSSSIIQLHPSSAIVIHHLPGSSIIIHHPSPSIDRYWRGTTRKRG